MKTPESIRNITIAAINRSAMNLGTWKYSRIVQLPFDHLKLTFELEEHELPVFEIQSEAKHTLITTHRILEHTSNSLNQVAFDNIDDVLFGLFKGQIDKPDLSSFRIIEMNGESIDFQLETGKAAIGLMKSIHVIRSLVID